MNFAMERIKDEPGMYRVMVAGVEVAVVHHNPEACGSYNSWHIVGDATKVRFGVNGAQTRLRGFRTMRQAGREAAIMNSNRAVSALCKEAAE